MNPQDQNYTSQLYDPDQSGQHTVQPAQQPQSPGLDYIPAAPSNAEVPIVSEITPVVETQPIPEAPMPPVYPTYTQQQPAPAAPPEPTVQPAPKIVNKATNKEHLHHVTPAADAITSLADKEEEEFITEVEKHHTKS